MTYPIVDGARRNRILAGLPLNQYVRLSEHLKAMELSAGQVLAEPGAALDFVYFPTTCTASLVLHTADGDSSELALTGRDGLVGVPLVLGRHTMNHRVVVQCAGQAYRIPADLFQSELAGSRELQQLSLGYVQALFTQMSQSIVCIGHHSVSERLCHWLLFNRDAVGSDQLKVTHETIANMLGVRRESITQALGKLQSSGVVASGRGKISILDPDGLQDNVCECFALVNAETQRLYVGSQNSEHFAKFEVTNELTRSTFDIDDIPAGSSGSAEDLLHKYQDAYDFAPVGFVSLDIHGAVVQTNLAGAIMLGIQRSQQHPGAFLSFVQPADQSAMAAFHHEVLSGKCRRYCEVTLSSNEHRPDMVVRIEATLDDQGEECHLVLIDVTEAKKIAATELAREREQQALLARQPFMLWFKDPQGRLISANSTLIEDWQHWAQGAALQPVSQSDLPVGWPGQQPSAASPPRAAY